MEGYIRRALIFIMLGDPTRAIADSSKAMLDEPVRALTVRGNAFRAKGDLGHAIDDYTAAIGFESNVASPIA